MPTVLTLYVALAASLPQEPEISFTDLNRFPCREAAWANWEFGCKHSEWIYQHTNRLSESYSHTKNIYERQAIEAWLGEMSQWRCEHGKCLQAWDYLADAWGPPQNHRFAQMPHYYTDTFRLSRLKHLRELIGREAYWSGRMPYCVPLERFALLP